MRGSQAYGRERKRPGEWSGRQRARDKETEARWIIDQMLRTDRPGR